jgi:long-chain acyl-CoA synthetase
MSDTKEQAEAPAAPEMNQDVDQKWKEAQQASVDGLKKSTFMSTMAKRKQNDLGEFLMSTNVGDNTWRNARSIETLSTTPFEDCKTVADIWNRSCREYPKSKCMGYRNITNVEVFGERKFERYCFSGFNWQTYEQVGVRVNNFSKGLASIGMKKGENIAIYADTKAEWQIAAQAAFQRGVAVGTVYANLGEDALHFGLNQMNATHVITDASLVKTIAPLLSRLPKLTNIIFTRDKRPAGQGGHMTDEEVIAQVTAEGVTVQAFETVEELGASAEGIEPSPPTVDDTAVIMYTSGSTGMPKGVEITHGQFVAGLSGVCDGVPNLCKEDRYIAYLPLAHILELIAENGILTHGGAIGYGSTKTITDASLGLQKGKCKGDAPELKPTVMAAVPAIMDKIRDGVNRVIAGKSSMVQGLFKRGYAQKQKQLERGQNEPFYDWLLFDKLRKKLLGGEIRFCLSGGGPLSKETQQFMNIVFCCPVGQGYGLTECCGAATIVWPNDRTYGRVGAPITCCEIKLTDWEEGGYTVNDQPNPRGEVVLAGAHISKGYFCEQEKTDESYKTDENGKRWFYTGDIGEFERDGVLRLIDRKKDLVKNQGGEYVSYGKLEPMLRGSDLIDNAMVYQDPFEGYCVALATVPEGNEKPDVEALLADFKKIGKENKLAKFEIPTKVFICDEGWTPENDLCTAALKLKRNNLKKFYESQLNELYGKASSGDSS